jgi:hypothetical protein
MSSEADILSGCFGGGSNPEKQHLLFILSSLVEVAEELMIAFHREGISRQRKARITDV